MADRRWAFLDASAPDHAIALTAPGGVVVDYGTLKRHVAGVREALVRPTKRLAFLFAGTDLACTAGYLALVNAGHAVALLDPNLSESVVRRLDAIYRPEYVLYAGPRAPDGIHRALPVRSMGEGPLGISMIERDASAEALDPRLCTLLTTSGTTGSPKLVRLSRENVAANLAAVTRVLGIGPGDRACAHLPLHYSFGLSVLLTHLAAGATVALTARSISTAEFWSEFRELGCTFLPGVPFHFEVLRRLDIERLAVPSLKVCAQAGGRLSPKTVEHLADKLAARAGRFYVMYGQTEAAPRMTTLPAELARVKPGSVGFAIPGGRVEIRGADGTPIETPGEDGEIIYHGPNVMLGYAERRADLALGDVCHGELHTGDLGHLDADGCLFITGRAARFAKLVGRRVNLDDIERIVADEARAAAVEADGRLRVYVETTDAAVREAVHRKLVDATRLHPTAIEVCAIDSLPVNAAGKIDFAALQVPR